MSNPDIKNKLENLKKYSKETINTLEKDINEIINHVEKDHKFKVDPGRVVFYGLCEECLKMKGDN